MTVLPLCSCGKPAADSAVSEEQEEIQEEQEEEETTNPLMLIDYIGLGKQEIPIGEDFTSAEFKLFSSRDWNVEYDRNLIKIEPENGPGQVDSQLVKVSLREGVAWDSYVPDAVFTAGKSSKTLAFYTYIPDYPLPQPGDTLKIIEFNILAGMKYDKANNFDNFVAWVKAQDPDVLLLCECNEFNDEKMRRLAARWRHPHVAVTVDDGWNPAITSKYPLEQLTKYSKGLSHGAVSAKIAGINYICVHSCASWFDNNDWYGGEPNDYDGNGSINSTDYRISELHCLFDQTIFARPEETRWILSGDLNAVSPTEKQWWYNGEGYFVEHNYILSLGCWTDIMRQQHPDLPMFTYSRAHDWSESSISSYDGKPNQMSYERLDYFYLSPELVPCAHSSAVLSDSFTDATSDHRPILLKIIYPE